MRDTYIMILLPLIFREKVHNYFNHICEKLLISFTGIIEHSFEMKSGNTSRKRTLILVCKIVFFKYFSNKKKNATACK